MPRLLALPWVAAVLFGCSSPASVESETVVVFAAASTGGAIDEICRGFERPHGVRVVANYAATSALVQQIAGGAEADVLLSANTLWADHLDQRGVLAQRRDLLTNGLVIVVAADSGAAFGGAEDLTSDDVRHIALADPDGPPAGIYARQALVSLGLWEKLKEKLAPEGTSDSFSEFISSGFEAFPEVLEPIWDEINEI